MGRSGGDSRPIAGSLATLAQDRFTTARPFAAFARLGQPSLERVDSANLGGRPDDSQSGRSFGGQPVGRAPLAFKLPEPPAASRQRSWCDTLHPLSLRCDRPRTRFYSTADEHPSTMSVSNDDFLAAIQGQGHVVSLRPARSQVRRSRPPAWRLGERPQVHPGLPGHRGRVAGPGLLAHVCSGHGHRGTKRAMKKNESPGHSLPRMGEQDVSISDAAATPVPANPPQTASQAPSTRPIAPPSSGPGFSADRPRAPSGRRPPRQADDSDDGYVILTIFPKAVVKPHMKKHYQFILDSLLQRVADDAILGKTFGARFSSIGLAQLYLEKARRYKCQSSLLQVSGVPVRLGRHQQDMRSRDAPPGVNQSGRPQRMGPQRRHVGHGRHRTRRNGWRGICARLAPSPQLNSAGVRFVHPELRLRPSAPQFEHSPARLVQAPSRPLRCPT